MSQRSFSRKDFIALLGSGAAAHVFGCSSDEGGGGSDGFASNGTTMGSTSAGGASSTTATTSSVTNSATTGATNGATSGSTSASTTGTTTGGGDTTSATNGAGGSTTTGSADSTTGAAGSGTTGAAGNGGTMGGAGGSSGGGMGGMNGAGGTASSSMCGGDVMAISSGEMHTHTVTIPLADIMAGTTQQYESSMDVGHTHWIELTDADFATLQSGGTVSKTTCSGGDHIFEISCAMDITASALPDNCSDECGESQQFVCPG